MLVPILTLLSALFLSTISAYYSILGLMAIFAAAPIPIMIMGGALEFAKIISTLWLHYYWERAEWKIKSYLVVAVFVLMGITSLGSLGFLSKSHLDQTVPSGDIQAQVSLFDEKIKTERENIEAARKALTQLDSTVDQLMARTIDDTGATKATDLRRSQRRERNNLNRDIDLSQKKIEQLQVDRAPIASKFRRAEADVGPIKYVAALIYGDNPSQNTLDSAVRLVIIIIVSVFDPLAIVLLLASTTSIDWIKEKREGKQEVNHEDSSPEENIQQKISDAASKVAEKTRTEDESEHQLKLDKALAEERKKYSDLLQNSADQSNTEEELSELTRKLQEVTEEFNNLAPLIVSLEEECSGLVSQDELLKKQLRTLIDSYDELFEEKTLLEEAIKQLDNEIETAKIYSIRVEELQKEMIDKDVEIKNTTIELNLLSNSLIEKNNEILEIKKELMGNNSVLQQEIIDKNILIDVLREKVTLNKQEIKQPESVRESIKEPNFLATVDNFPKGGNASFGVSFPVDPINGDLFLRVDYLPSKLFKWVSSRWVEVDKSVTDAFMFDEEYIKLLVSKVSSGEYDVEDLNQAEQEKVALYLKNHPK